MDIRTIILLIAGIALGGLGTIGVVKATKPKIVVPACPPCNCPPATEVKMASFDLSKLNNKKGSFTYAPQISHVRIIIEAKDSVWFKAVLKSK